MKHFEDTAFTLQSKFNFGDLKLTHVKTYESGKSLESAFHQLLNELRISFLDQELKQILQAGLCRKKLICFNIKITKAQRAKIYVTYFHMAHKLNKFY